MAGVESVLITGGGTGGHVSPALALGVALTALVPGLRVRYVGGRRGIEGRMVPARGGEITLLPVEPLPRGIGLGVVRFVAGLLLSLLQGFRLLREVRPRLCLATGGYASVPVSLVSRARGVPLYVQEQNAVPGLASRFLGRLSRKAFVAFDEARLFMPRSRTVVAGNPVRPDIDRASRAESRRKFGLPEDGFVLLVFGGSQGASRINRALSKAAMRLSEKNVAVLWQTGRSDYNDALELVKTRDLNWVVLPFIDDMPSAYAACDLSVSRAGALSVAELTACGVPMILVPYPFAAADHQAKNAAALVSAGAAVAVPDSELDGERLASEVESLVENESKRAEMARASRALGRPDAANAIARLILDDAREFERARGILR
jgi:UDP-N-acetylglucosamine--N-acetylmuramyl-(pentapeptide) pyrophosphoryl-undecaprenol N-acetylglucosamine transferase